MLQPMAALGVLNFNLPPGLTMKLNNINDNNSDMNLLNSAPGSVRLSKTFNKITVQNVLSENNANALNIAQGNPNAIVRKIKDFGMIGTVNSAGANSLNITSNSRKRPLSETGKQQSPVVKQRKSSPSVAKKPKLSKEERTALRLAKKAAKENSSLGVAGLPHGLIVTAKIPGTPGRKGLPLPQAVARRNARERNRVKQVNNGFAALRERIPEEVAEAFEAHSSCKNNGKKLSKVETLRMAVEYIRSLERLLGFDFPLMTAKGFHSTSSSGEDSFSLIKDEFDAFSPSMEDDNFEDSLSHYDSEEYFAVQPSPAAALPDAASHSLPQIETLPNITTLNGLQYIRIPGTNTYQLLTPDIFVGTAASPPSSTVDEEQFNALIDTNCGSPSTSMVMSMSSPTTTTTTTTATTATLSSLAHATADGNSSPPSIKSSAMCMTSPVLRTETAPVATQMKCVVNAEGSQNVLSSSSSPVPQHQQQPQQQQQQRHHQQQMLTTSSPSATSTGNTNNNDPTAIATLQATTPANANNEHHHQRELQMEDLRQACARNQQQQQHQQQLQQLQQQLQLQQQQQLQRQLTQTPTIIKQEFEDPPILYQQHQQISPLQHHHYLHNHNSMTMSPPLDHPAPTTSNASNVQLQQFFNPTSQTIFFDNVVNLKKEFTEDLLDGAHTSNVLSDESMIETIDWWEAHTPKSEGGSVMM